MEMEVLPAKETATPVEVEEKILEKVEEKTPEKVEEEINVSFKHIDS